MVVNRGMQELPKIWTFDPAVPERFQTVKPKVLLVGAEPNGLNPRGRTDMGDWFRHSIGRSAFANSRFLKGPLLQLEAVVLGKLDGLWRMWSERKDEVRERLLPHLRYVDLKAEEGSQAANVLEVRAWVKQYPVDVEALFTNPQPDVVLLQGGIAQRVFVELVRPSLLRMGIRFQWAGMPHPSAQEPYPELGAQQLPARLQPIQDLGFRWSQRKLSWEAIRE